MTVKSRGTKVLCPLPCRLLFSCQPRALGANTYAGLVVAMEERSLNKYSENSNSSLSKQWKRMLGLEMQRSQAGKEVSCQGRGRGRA
jgi:hypothetical protein